MLTNQNKKSQNMTDKQLAKKKSDKLCNKVNKINIAALIKSIK